MSTASVCKVGEVPRARPDTIFPAPGISVNNNVWFIRADPLLGTYTRDATGDTCVCLGTRTLTASALSREALRPVHSAGCSSLRVCLCTRTSPSRQESAGPWGHPSTCPVTPFMTNNVAVSSYFLLLTTPP